MHAKYFDIVAHCETFLAAHGDNYRGVGWTKSQQDADLRYQIMLEVIQGSGPASLLDFGCGLSHLLEYLRKIGRTGIEYSGLDLSKRMLQISRSKFPHIEYYDMDVISDISNLPEFDYIIMNGVFTMRHILSVEEMNEYFHTLVSATFAKARIGLAFNVMSKLVDWEREDLFHLGFDELASFLHNSVSRHFLIRHDYRLYEYTTYIYR